MKRQKTYQSLRSDVLDLNESLSALLSDLKSHPDGVDGRFEEWQESCRDIRQQINEELLRVAVIGSVKSGKSTLVNALFRGDYLKRGAGVVTSIVTRIRTGDSLRAVLFFKSWDDVNAEMDQALTLLPSWDEQGHEKSFDIRREKDRQSLHVALQNLSDDLIVTDGFINTSSMILSLYLKGYDRISPRIAADSMTTEFAGEDFPEHQTFVGDDALAVYLKDIELEIEGDTVDKTIEIADCQGSDSPNPLHLAMIQDYLLRTHFIVYVISSRTGLRQADIKFLSMIRKMGIIENIVFVLNIDFNEHESLDDLSQMVNKVKEELSILRPDPEVYAISCLFNLFLALEDSLSSKDSRRFAHWKAEDDLVNFSRDETKQFETALNEKLSYERFGLLLRNHLERMGVMIAGIDRWLWMTRELLEKDVDGAAVMLRKIKHHEDRIEQIKSLTKSTLSGTSEETFRKVKADIDRFFNVYSGDLMKRTLSFVQQYSPPLEAYHEKVATAGFTQTLYVAFQEFRQALDRFMAESVNPEIAQFALRVEERIRTDLESAALPFYDMASDMVSELDDIVGNPARSTSDPERSGSRLLAIDRLKKIAGLALPTATATLNYSSKVKGGALLKLGMYSAVKLFRKAFKKPVEDEREGQVRALADGVLLIKGETEKALRFHFENYRENFKFQYVSRLVEGASQYLHQLLMERFQSCDANMKTLEGVVENKGTNREKMIAFLNQSVDTISGLRERVDSLRKKLERPA